MVLTITVNRVIMIIAPLINERKNQLMGVQKVKFVIGTKGHTMAGRKKKELSDEVINRRHRIGEELKSLRLSLGYTQEEMGRDFLDNRASVPKIRRWEKGRVDLPMDASLLLERKTGVIREYWSGETEIKNREEYEEQKQYDKAANSLCDDISKNLMMQYKEKIALYNRLFEICGYEYECFADCSSWMEMRIVISGSDDDDYTVWHSLTFRENPGKQFYFTTDRLSAMFDDFKNIVDLACLRDNQNDEFCKEHGDSIMNQNEISGGNDNAEEK